MRAISGCKEKDRDAAAGNEDELSETKRELLQADVRLAKGRANVAAAEIGINVISAR